MTAVNSTLDTLPGALSAETVAAVSSDELPDPTGLRGKARQQILRIESLYQAMGENLPAFDLTQDLGDAVGSLDEADAPVHRWYYYKESYSPRLPERVAEIMGVDAPSLVLDPFCGVGTTGLWAAQQSSVRGFVGIDRSPFAVLASTAKTNWRAIRPAHVRTELAVLSKAPLNKRLKPPGLSTFTRDGMFPNGALASLLAIRQWLKGRTLGTTERQAMLLALAACVDAYSGAKKDGRALRIVGTERTSRLLTPVGYYPKRRDPVVTAFIAHVMAMIEDVELLRPTAAEPLEHCSVIAGDARKADETLIALDSNFAESFDYISFSPPYLNFIDYTEVYKLELWMLELVVDPAGFNDLRHTTLRSHPSVKFDERYSRLETIGEVGESIIEAARFMADNLPRRSSGVTLRHYFEDMLATLDALRPLTAPGGLIAITVGNSTFAPPKGGHWALPIPTDVILARLAEAAGFTRPVILSARHLRPRNTRARRARESVVVLRG